MTRKVSGVSAGFGKGLRKDEKRRQEEQNKAWRDKAVPESTSQTSRSVLEQSSLDDIIATVQLRKEEWDEMYGDAEVVDEGPVLLDLDRPLVDAENAAAKSRELMSIPRRPKWHEGMGVEELATLETEAFTEWRRGLKQLEHDGGLVMTPYERNLDFWRQLWRCMERSDLLVQVLDARDPDFYFCQDLYTYVSELGGSKRLMLIVNKADFLSEEQRQRWADHFQARDIDAVFFSALTELQKLAKSERAKSIDADIVPDSDSETGDQAQGEAAEDRSNAANVPVPDSEDDELADNATRNDTKASDASEIDGAGSRPTASLDDSDVADVARLLDELRTRLPQKGAEDRQGVVGFVGYPNVGKSTIINALVGEKKVGMSRTPGKTKHIQTLQLPEWGFTLCDAPGLVFPSVVATRAHLVINNTVPLDDLRECFSPIRIIVEKIGFQEVLRRYNCSQFVKDAAKRSGDHVLDEAHSFLAAFAVSRNHFLWVGVPDENWAARKVLRDYVCGKLLHCENPPTTAIETGSTAEELGSLVQSVQTGTPAEEEDEDDFDDLEDLMCDGASTAVVTKLTKRKERHLKKQLGRGVATPNPGPKKRDNARAKALG